MELRLALGLKTDRALPNHQRSIHLRHLVKMGLTSKCKSNNNSKCRINLNQSNRACKEIKALYPVLEVSKFSARHLQISKEIVNYQRVKEYSVVFLNPQGKMGKRKINIKEDRLGRLTMETHLQLIAESSLTLIISSSSKTKTIRLGRF
jgi:hypothetical protein